MRRPWSFTQRLALGLVGTSLLALVIATAAIQAIVSVSRAGASAAGTYAENLVSAERLQLAAERKVAVGRALLLTGSPALAGQLEDARAGFLTELAQLRAQAPGARAELDAVVAAERDHERALDELVRAKLEGLPAGELARRFEREVLPNRIALDKALNGLIARVQGELGQARAQALGLERKTVRRILVIAGGGLLLALTMGFLLMRTLNRLWEARQRTTNEAERSQRRYADLVEGLGDTIVWEARQSSLQTTFVSPRVAELTGFPVARWLEGSQFWRRNVPDRDLAELTSAIERLRAGEPRTVEHRFFTADGQVLWFRTSMRLTQEPGEAPLVRGFSIDITRLREADEELRVNAREQAAVAALGQRALLAGDIDALLGEAAQAVAATLDIEFGSVFELLPEGRTLLLRAGAGWAEGIVGTERIELEPGSPLETALRSGEPLIFGTSAGDDSRRSPQQVCTGELATCLYAPIDRPTGRFGLLGVHSPHARSFSPEDVHFVQAIANVVATALERRSVDERLRESEQRFRLLVENVEDYSIVMLDPEGRVVSWNAGAERIAGYTATEIIGKSWAIFFPTGERRGPWPSQLLESARREGKAESEGWRLRHDGRPFWADETLSAVRDRTGTAVGFTHIMRDITERRRVEEVQKLLLEEGEALSQSLDYDHTVSVVAALGVPRFADLCALAVLTPDGAAGRVETAAVTPEAQRRIREHFERFPPDPRASAGLGKVLGTGEPEFIPEVGPAEASRYGTRAPNRTSMLKALGVRSLITVPLVGRSRTLGAISFAILGERRHYDRKDLEVALELARRAALALDNARLYRDAQDAIRARDQFLSIASHELKTPVTSFQLQVQSLIRAIRREPNASVPLTRIAPKLLVMQRQSERLARLINNLLDISRITSGELDLHDEELDLTALVRDVIDRSAEDLERAGCAVELDAPEPIIGRWDRLRLEQVVANLLSNALKYGAGRAIGISLRREDHAARLQVRDRGIGIAEADRARIFERFERAVSERHYGGFGLGLWIVRQIVVALGGEVHVESAPGQGSTFTVTLPLGEVRAAEPARTALPPPEQPGL